MSVVLPKPKFLSESEVVLARADWDRIVELLEGSEAAEELAEDAGDIAAVAVARAEDAAFGARIATERGTPVEITIPVEIVEAKLEGVHPIRAWRNYRDWTQLYLSVKSGVGRDLIAQIETRRKNGSVETLDRLARALGVPMEALIEDSSR
jgi:DNA-binding XRE family transcriptional regulator